jgi:hypothetical protein
MICRKPHMASSMCLRATIFQKPEGTLWTNCIFMWSYEGTGLAEAQYPVLPNAAALNRNDLLCHTKKKYDLFNNALYTSGYIVLDGRFIRELLIGKNVEPKGKSN